LSYFLFNASPTPRHLHSFPTRRSSDLFNPNLSAHVGQRTAGLVGETARNTRHRPAAVFVAHDRRHYCPDASKHLRVIDVGHRASDRKSTRLNSSHVSISYAVFCLKKKI